MKEIEILSSIDKEVFYRKIEEFTGKYGKPERQRRLGIILSSYAANNIIDTRLKITNGVIHMVQKTGKGLDAHREVSENNLDLKMNSQELLTLVRMLQNFGSLIDGFTSSLQQFENYLFQTVNSEVKFYMQSNGNDTFYGFEVELNTDSQGNDLFEECKRLGLVPDSISRDSEYWYDYDKRYNLNAMELSDSQLIGLFDKFLE